MRGPYGQLMGRERIRDPRRLLSRETGTVFKDWGGRLPVALVYPNSYYLGMSNLGIHAIYRLLNGYGDVVCERVFWQGLGARPAGLESGRPLTDYAVLAFSITYELDYLNIAPILRAAGIPPLAADRDERHPLIIAGGACMTANPMPVAPFFDGLCIGEAEAILPAALAALSGGIAGPREDLLRSLAGLPGIYVPRHRPARAVRRQWADDLDGFPVATAVITPDTELGNLYLMEVERGCNRGCRFCLVSNAYRPARYRSVPGLLEQAREGLRHRRRLGLVGPAVTDHPHIEELVTALRAMGAELSASSLRVRPLSPVVLGAVIGSGARSIALAPEAGSDRLRRLVSKGIAEDDVLRAVHEVARLGVRQVKLYFMIGLPSEEAEDVEDMARLSLECKAVLDSTRGGSRLTLAVSAFIPKAGTAFQWLPMAQPTVLRDRLSRLKSRLEPKGIPVRSESLAWSEVQAVLARGDARLAGALAAMEAPTLSRWRRALAAADLDATRYAYRHIDAAEILPWAAVDSGTSPGHLRREMQRALALASA